LSASLNRISLASPKNLSWPKTPVRAPILVYMSRFEILKMLIVEEFEIFNTNRITPELFKFDVRK
jgi:hypothetical protein